MATLEKQWKDGGILSASYSGVGNATITFSSDINEGVDREIEIAIRDLDNTISIERTVRQYGKREEFNGSDGEIFMSDGGTFNVIK